MKYLERLVAKQEGNVTAKDNEFRARQNKAQLDSDLIATEMKVEVCVRSCDALLSADNLDSIAILEAQDNIKRASRDVKSIKVLIKDLF
jgi:hypothetical protein